MIETPKTEEKKETENPVNYDLIDKTIFRHEGERLNVYLDSLGNPTVGVGHLVKPEDNLKVGDKITPERSRQLFAQDRDIALKYSFKIFPDFNTFPDTAQAAVTSIIYNVGGPKFSSWKTTIDLIKSKDWQKVAAYFNSSAFDKWRSQVGRRVTEIADLFKSAGTAGLVFSLLGLGVISFIIYKVVQHRGAIT